MRLSGFRELPHTDSRVALRAALIAAALALGGLVGLVAPRLSGETSLNMLVGGAFLALLLVVFARNIALAPIAILASVSFFNVRLGTGTATQIPLSFVVTLVGVGVWLAQVLRRRAHAPSRSAANVWLMVFAGSFVLSMFWGWLLWQPELFDYRQSSTSGINFVFVQFGAIGIVAALAGAFWMTQSVVRSRASVAAMFALIVVVSVFELAQRFVGQRIVLDPLRISGPALFHIIIVGLLAGQAMFNRDLRPSLRALCWLGVAAWMGVGLIGQTAWAAAWAPPFAALLFLAWLKSWRLGLLLSILPIPILLLGSDYFYHGIVVESLRDDGNRLSIWTNTIRLTLQHSNPLFGFGPAGYLPFLLLYTPWQAISSHNTYTDVFGQAGLIGIVAFLGFIASLLRAGLRQRHRIEDGFLRGFAVGALGCLVGCVAAMVLNDWFLPFVYNTGYAGFEFSVTAWTVLGAMLGMGSWAVVEKSPPHG